MDFSTELLTDVALNAAGFLAAGAFSVVVYLIFRRSGKAAIDSRSPRPATAAAEAGREPAGKKLQYVRLAEDAPESAPALAMSTQDGSRYRRNRAEVIRLAREMVKSGTARERIKDLLPISETELTLLSRDNY